MLPQRPVVLMTGIASGTTATSLNGAVMTLGGRVARTFDLSVSHVVCRVDENRRATSRAPCPCCVRPQPHATHTRLFL